MNLKSRVLTVLAVCVLAVAYYLLSPLWRVVEVHELAPVVAQQRIEQALLAQADFQAQAHEVLGRAVLLQDEQTQILRFEDFETVNGPNLHIYLATNLQADEFIDLGEIKATKGSVNYTLPPDVDLVKYNKVLVWCVPFKVLFSYADLDLEA